MLTQERHATDPAAVTSLAILHDLLDGYHPRDFAVRLWDGTTWEPEAGAPPRFTLKLNHRGALRRMFWPPGELALSEAYVYGDFDIDGDVERVFALGEHLLGPGTGLAVKARLARRVLSLPDAGHPLIGRRGARLKGRRHSIERDRMAVTYHYDVSNDFYALWQDSRMMYSCALFASPDETLEAAQTRKLEYICRKLRLRRGEKLLDIGCGWGGLISYAAEKFGVEALGVTLSQPQADLANERIRAAGLADRCRVEVRDYREVDTSEQFDKLVSVGMFEHVGATLLKDYMNRAFRMLKPGGVFLNHGIAINALNLYPAGMGFSQKYVFPDGELVPIGETLRAAEAVGFEARDVESLREHYALTLRNWVRGLEARHDESVRVSDEVTYRVWRLYMSGSAYQFAKGYLNVYQTLLAKPKDGASGLPLQRADWYEPGLE
jgi:cyclopropane-fatty-acyl-phospholipid synthase